MIDELSDEAAAKFVKNVTLDPTEFPPIPLWLLVWREAVRRAEALIAEEQKHKAKLYDLLKATQDQLVTERRKTFFKAWKTCAFLWDGDASEAYIEQAYRAYTEAEKEEK